AELTNLLVNVLNAFQAPRLAAAQAIAGSAEAEGNAVRGYYQQFLGRTPSQAEVNGWVNQLLAGTTREQVIAAFVSSAEYIQKHPGNSQLVDQLYLDLLGRQRAAAETGFVTALNNGTATPAEVATAILQSTEYAQRLVNQFYSTALNRVGSTTETSGWVQSLQQGTRDEQVFSQILASGEYFQRPHQYP